MPNNQRVVRAQGRSSQGRNDFRERRGAHRPRGYRPWVVAGWILGLVAVFTIGLGAKKLLSDSPTPARVATNTQITTSPATSPVSPSAPATEKKPTTAPVAVDPAAVVDRTALVQVLNSTKTSGLAARVSAGLKTKKWKISGTGNYSAGPISTTIFYADPTLLSTAKELAKDLGGSPKLTQSNTASTSKLTVVMGSDYQE